MKRNLPIPARRGSSLIDVVAASVLTAAVLVPSSRVLRETIRSSERLQARQEMLLQCQSLLESELQSTAQGGRLQTKRGRLRTDAGDFRYELTASDRAVWGGQPGRLIAVSSLVWEDVNRNNRHDAQELHVSLYCKTQTP